MDREKGMPCGRNRMSKITRREESALGTKGRLVENFLGSWKDGLFRQWVALNASRVCLKVSEGMKDIIKVYVKEFDSTACPE